MENSRLRKIEEGIRNASPLNLASQLQEAELYDQKETKAVVDEVYKEFKDNTNIKKEILEPVFFSILDGLLECSSITRKARRKGLTVSRVVSECKSFSYNRKEFSYFGPDGYTEWKNIGEQTASNMKYYGDNVRQRYNRGVYEDKGRLDAYKENKFNNNGGRINAEDDYTGEKNVYQYRSNPDARRNVEKYKHDHQAEVDHIIPLAKVHERYKGNYALTDDDIKNIANQESNFALTSAKINRGAGASGKGGKFDKTIPEFLADQRERETDGRPNLGISEDAKDRMLTMHDMSQKEMDKNANKAIVKNLSGRGRNTKEIYGTATKDAAKQSGEYVIGNVILFVVKPLYYEIADMFKNGVKGGEGVQADTTQKALRIRFGRIKQYVVDNAWKVIKENAREFIKGFVSSLIEGIISLFVGIFRQVLKVIKEGIKIFVQAGKVLFGKEASQMSSAEKGDAIIKIIGGSVITISGIGIEALLNKIGVGEPWSVVLSTILSGIASALFMLLLDKLDLFSVKDEKRRKRIEDIFKERIKDIKEAEKTMNTAAIETMRRQRLQFASIRNNIQNGIESNNVDEINSGLFKMANFMNIELGYTNRKEFVDNFDNAQLEL